MCPRTDGPVAVELLVPFGDIRGGAEAMLVTLLDSLNRDAIDLGIAFHQDGELVERALTLGYDAACLDAGRLRQPHRYLASLRTLRKRRDRRRPRVILSWIAKSHLYAAPAALERASPRLAWWQHGVPQGDPLDRLATLLPAD